MWRAIISVLAVAVTASVIASSAVAFSSYYVEHGRLQTFLVVPPGFTDQIGFWSYVKTSNQLTRSLGAADLYTARVTFKRLSTFQQLLALTNAAADEVLWVTAEKDSKLECVRPGELGGIDICGPTAPSSIVDALLRLPGNSLAGIVGRPEVLCVEVGPVDQLGWYKNAQVIWRESLWNAYMAYGTKSGEYGRESKTESQPRFGFETISPNPFNPATVMAFSLEVPAMVRLVIYDASGRAVRMLLQGQFEAGSHKVEWRGTDDRGQRLASGVYFCRIEAGAAGATRRITLVR